MNRLLYTLLFIILLLLSVGITQAQQGVGGQIVYNVETGSGSALVLYDISTRSERFLTDGQFWDWGPELSPSGTQVVFVSNRDGDNNIYLINTDGTGLRRLSSNPTIDYDPTWSPDGSRIAYVTRTGSSRNVETRLSLVNADGTNTIELNLGDGGGKQPAWSPNGQQLAFSSWRGGGDDHLFVVNVDGTGLRQLTFGSDLAFYPKWSPDGTKIAFHGGGISFIDALTGGNVQRITANLDASLEGWVSNDTLLYTQAGLGGYYYTFTIRIDGTGLTDLNFQLPQGGSAFNLSRVVVNTGATSTPTPTLTFTPTLTPTPTATLTGTTVVTQIGSTGSDQNENGTTWESGRTTLNTLVAVPLEQ
jgi:Tol biopolymer transport system component